MAQVSTQMEIGVREALKAWASSIYAIGFAAGVKLAMSKTETTEGGLVVPKRPPLVVP